MDSKTLHWYDLHGRETATRYESAQSPLAPYLQRVFPAGCSVLDVGCGSGRDMAFLRSAGFDAWGLEPSATMMQQALNLHPQLEGRILQGGLPDTGLSASHTFDVVMCMASFMHVPARQTSDAAAELCRRVKPGGRLLLSVPSQRTGLDGDAREPGGRLFTPLSQTHLQSLFEGFGLTLKEAFLSGDALGRDGVQWVTLLLEKNMFVDQKAVT